MDLVTILPFLGIFRTVLGDIFTTGFEVKELVRFERNLVDSLDTYFQRQEKNGVTFDSPITNFVEKINIKNKEISSENTDGLENPISRFHVTKRLAKEWSVLKENLTCYGEECPLLTGEDVFKAVFKREKRDLPSDHELNDAALTLLHIWNVYDFDLADLAGGKMDGINNVTLSPDDIFYIANAAKDARKFYGAIKWFEYLVAVQDDLDLSDSSFKLVHVYRKLASTYHEYGMTPKSVELLEAYLEKDPNNKAVLGDLKYYKSSRKGDEGAQTEVKRFKDENSQAAKVAKTYRKLCQMSLKVPANRTILSCYSRPLFRTYGVSKQEVLSLTPRIVLIHDFLDNNETSVLLKYTGKESGIRIEAQENGKALKSDWICEKYPKYPFFKTLSLRIEAVTDFKIWPLRHRSSSECYQFTYKGIGKESQDEKEYWPKKQVHPEVGNRYVTVRFQLSDVQYGGATVFPKLGIRLPIVKNSAVLWWNLKDDGTPNPRSVHRDCPVIIGSNWSVSKNIFYNNQYDTRYCEAR